MNAEESLLKESKMFWKSFVNAWVSRIKKTMSLRRTMRSNNRQMNKLSLIIWIKIQGLKLLVLPPTLSMGWGSRCANVAADSWDFLICLISSLLKPSVKSIFQVFKTLPTNWKNSLTYKLILNWNWKCQMKRLKMRDQLAYLQAFLLPVQGQMDPVYLANNYLFSKLKVCFLKTPSLKAGSIQIILTCTHLLHLVNLS